MRLGPALLVFRRHARDLSRDRRTLLSLFLMPVIVVVVLLISRDELTQRIVTNAQVGARVAVEGADESPALVAALSERGLVVVRTADARRAVRDEGADIGVALGSGFSSAIASGARAQVRILMGERSTKAQFAYAAVSASVTTFRDRVVAERLERAGIPQSVLEPIDVRDVDVASAEERSGFFLGEFLPLMLLAQMVGVMVTVATDVTAGEKERRTVEALLATPLRRSEIAAGKWLATAGAGLLAGVATLGAAIGTLATMSSAGDTLGASGPVPPGAIGPLAAGIVAFGMLTATVMLALGFSARSMQQAGAFMTPLFLLVLLPTMLMVESDTGTVWLYAIPFLGPIRLMADALASALLPGALPVALGATTLYAAAAVVLLGRIVGGERALLRAQT